MIVCCLSSFVLHCASPGMGGGFLCIVAILAVPPADLSPTDYASICARGVDIGGVCIPEVARACPQHACKDDRVDICCND